MCFIYKIKGKDLNREHLALLQVLLYRQPVQEHLNEPILSSIMQKDLRFLCLCFAALANAMPFCPPCGLRDFPDTVVPENTPSQEYAALNGVDGSKLLKLVMGTRWLPQLVSDELRFSH